MAFNTAPAVQDNNGIPENKKAYGFLNFYLPNKAGGRRKLGAITLRKSQPNEVALADWLTEDPKRIALILSQLEIEYNPVVPDEGSAFDLSDVKPGKKDPKK